MIIDLEKARTPQELNEECIIQDDAQKKFRDIVERILVNIDNNIIDSNTKNEIYYTRYHNAINILGPRGSGKTTFLFNMLKKNDNLNQELVELKIIDPTLIESKENILVAIISQISSIVNERYNNTCNPDESKFLEWNKSLQNLSRGLCILDEIGVDPLKKECWHDPNYVLQEGLKNATCGLDLERNFNKFIKRSLNVIGESNKAFLIIFDDIDTNFIKGWNVLETVRKYLTSPNLVVVLSGDFELYSLLVRKHQWENLGDFLVAHESNKDHLKNIVDKLEEQYLMKVLRPENRIELHGLKYYYDAIKFNDGSSENDNKKVIWVRFKDKSLRDNKRSLVEVLNDICKVLWGINNDDYAKSLYINCILNQPLRTIIEILHAYEEYIITVSKDRIKAHENFCKKFAIINITSLYAVGYNLEDINNILDSDKVDIGNLIIKLLELDLLRNDISFTPNSKDEYINIYYCIINALYSYAIHMDIRMIGAFFIKLGLLHEIYNHEYNNRKSEFINEIIPFFQLNKEVMTIKVARLFTAYYGRNSLGLQRIAIIDSRTNSNRMQLLTKMIYGVENPLKVNINELPLYVRGFVDYYKSCNYLDNFRNQRYSLVVSPLSLKDKIYGNNIWIRNIIDILFSYRAVESNNELYYSFFYIIAAIFDFSTITKNLSICRIKSYAAFSSYEANSSLLNIDSNNDTMSVERLYLRSWTQGSGSTVSDRMKQWEKKMKSIDATPINLWRNIWSRLYTSLSNMKIKNDRYLGEIINRHLVQFFNAILTEELIYNKVNNKGRYNPTTSNKVFINQLKRRDAITRFRKSSYSPLFDTIFSCPIWSLFTNPQNKSSKDCWEYYYWKQFDDPTELCVISSLSIVDRHVAKDGNLKDLHLYDLLNVVPCFYRPIGHSVEYYEIKKAIKLALSTENFDTLITKSMGSRVHRYTINRFISIKDNSNLPDMRSIVKKILKDIFGLEILDSNFKLNSDIRALQDKIANALA